MIENIQRHIFGQIETQTANSWFKKLAVQWLNQAFCFFKTVGANYLPLQCINISHLPIGIYFINIGNYTEKFMVVK